MARAAYNTSKCPFCGIEITVSGTGRTSHLRTHVKAGETVEVIYPALSYQDTQGGTVNKKESRTFETPERQRQFLLNAPGGGEKVLGTPAALAIVNGPEATN